MPPNATKFQMALFVDKGKAEAKELNMSHINKHGGKNHSSSSDKQGGSSILEGWKNVERR